MAIGFQVFSKLDDYGVLLDQGFKKDNQLCCGRVQAPQSRSILFFFRMMRAACSGGESEGWPANRREIDPEDTV
jgi:hypothetical protein